MGPTGTLRLLVLFGFCCCRCCGDCTLKTFTCTNFLCLCSPIFQFFHFFFVHFFTFMHLLSGGQFVQKIDFRQFFSGCPTVHAHPAREGKFRSVQFAGHMWVDSSQIHRGCEGKNRFIPWLFQFTVRGSRASPHKHPRKWPASHEKANSPKKDFRNLAILLEQTPIVHTFVSVVL